MESEIIFYTNPMSRGGIIHWMLEALGVAYRMEMLEYGSAEVVARQSSGEG